MAKNRDYTGLVRTPPSMAWLIRKRSILQGELDRAKKDLDRLPRTICELEQKLVALDQHVFPMHEVRVDPKSIKGTREIGKSVLPFGVMTKNILACLRLAGGCARSRRRRRAPHLRGLRGRQNRRVAARARERSHRDRQRSGLPASAARMISGMALAWAVVAVDVATHRSAYARTGTRDR